MFFSYWLSARYLHSQTVSNYSCKLCVLCIALVGSLSWESREIRLLKVAMIAVLPVVSNSRGRADQTNGRQAGQCDTVARDSHQV